MEYPLKFGLHRFEVPFTPNPLTIQIGVRHEKDMFDSCIPLFSFLTEY